MGSVSEKFAWDNPGSPNEMLRGFNFVVKTVGLKTILQVKDEICFHPNTFVTKTDQQKYSELLFPTSETIATLTETLNLFISLEKFLQWPSENTANQLQFLVDRGKRDKLFQIFKVDKLLATLRNFLNKCSQHGELELQGAGAQAIVESQTVKELQDEITKLKTENQEILELLGETLVEGTAKVDEKRRSELFQQIFRSNNKPMNDRLHSTQDNGNLDSNSSASQNGFPKPQTKNESASSPPANAPVTDAPSQQSAREAEALVQEGSHQDGIEIPGHHDLPLPIQESDTNGREYITPENIPDRRRTAATDGMAGPSVTNNARNTGGSNGSKLSKFQRPMSPSVSRDLDQSQEDNHWSCGHYKRHCYVKFECCDNFWPCHRCHNDQSTCGRRKLTSRDTKMVKCMDCDKVQQFGQFCCDCGATFAEYFCDLCKHLTGKDDHPYHCEKCGICRVHGDSSFHCEVCGLCLDVQLRGNHKCREGSAHEECCICLEDAFTGCQILPCSHKVHKKCATQMIRSARMVRCPICRESFALIFEGGQLPNSRKRTGK